VKGVIVSVFVRMSVCVVEQTLAVSRAALISVLTCCHDAPVKEAREGQTGS